MEKTLIVGAGGIGGVLGARLSAAGQPVVMMTRNPAIREAIEQRGLRASLPQGREVRVRPQIASGAEELEGDEFSTIVLAVPPDAIESVARSVDGLRAPGGQFVCCANGLLESRLARAYGEEGVVGGVVSFGATMYEPGVVAQTSGGSITLGRPARAERARDEALERLAGALGRAVPTRCTDNLMGTRWSKLALNCVVSALGTIGRSELGPLMVRGEVRRLALEIITEVVAAAAAHGVELERVQNTLDLEKLSLADERGGIAARARLIARHAALIAVGTRYRRMRSSMLRALERGRPLPVRYLNGEVVEAAREVGLVAPVNEAIVALLERIEAGEAEPGPELIAELYRSTRS